MNRTIDFIIKANHIHCNEYDYSNTQYIRSNHKVEIICNKHGSFFVTPNNHLSNRSGCPTCAIYKQKSTVQSKQRDTFIDECCVVHQYKYDYSMTKYTNAHSKIDIICPTHGVFQMVAYTHKQGGNCPKCAKIIASKKISLSQSDFIVRSTLKHQDKYDYSYVDYHNTKTKVQIICPYHGPFFQRPVQHLRGEGCPTCGMEAWWREQGGYSNTYFDHNPTEKGCPALLYVVLFKNSTEQFYKIGITKHQLQQRFHWGYTAYTMEVITTKQTTLFDAYTLEQQLLTDYKQYQYIPTIKFGGWTECLSYDADIATVLTGIS